MYKEKIPLVKMSGICKSYPGVQALSNLDFELFEGEVHSLCGENGAGKSTLIKILTGYEQMDSGSIVYLGNPIRPATTLEAQMMGISTVYQEVNLCPNLTVAENIYIGRQPKNRLGLVDWKEIKRLAEKAMARLNLKLDVNARLDEYSVAIQQMVAIARALDMNAKVLVLDEPTSSLDTSEVENLFHVVNNLKKQGMGIVFISHFFEQVFEISDRITVLRNGHFVGSYAIEDISRQQLIEKMLGKELTEFSSGNKEETVTLEGKSVLCQMQNIGKRGTIEGINLSVEEGVVVGFAGLLGSGRTETARLLFGVDKADDGVIRIKGEQAKIRSPQNAVHYNFAFCPEDRKREVLLLNMTIRDNIILALQGKNGMFRRLPLKKQREIADEFIEKLQIVTPSQDQLVGNLSGGNQQKVLVARWMVTDPDLLILDEPTRGIDVGVKAEILKLILQLAESGRSVVFISSEISEVCRCAQKVYVFKDRNIIGQLEGEDVQEYCVMNAIAQE